MRAIRDSPLSLTLPYLAFTPVFNVLFGMVYGAWLFGEAGLKRNLAAGELMVLGVFLVAG